jgi:hypothetical protein
MRKGRTGEAEGGREWEQGREAGDGHSRLSRASVGLDVSTMEEGWLSERDARRKGALKEAVRGIGVGGGGEGKGGDSTRVRGQEGVRDTAMRERDRGVGRGRPLVGYGVGSAEGRRESGTVGAGVGASGWSGWEDGEEGREIGDLDAGEEEELEEELEGVAMRKLLEYLEIAAAEPSPLTVMSKLETRNSEAQSPKPKRRAQP